MPKLVSDQVSGSTAAPSEGGPRPVVGWLSGVVDQLGRLNDPDSLVSDAERIDRISLLERLRAAVAGAQAEEVVRFAQSQVVAQREADVDPRVVGRGIADQVGLACKVSPSAGSARLGLARALWFDLPCTFAAVRRGEVSEWVATLVSRETSHLDAATRRAVDAELAAKGLGSMSPGRAAGAARKLAYQADPVGACKRARVEEGSRRVTLRPAPDTMSVFTAYLPVAQGVAAFAALKKHADGCIAGGDPRSLGQLMADSLVERVTGQASAGDVRVEVGILMPLDTLVPPDVAERHGARPHGAGPHCSQPHGPRPHRAGPYEAHSDAVQSDGVQSDDVAAERAESDRAPVGDQPGGARLDDDQRRSVHPDGDLSGCGRPGGDQPRGPRTDDDQGRRVHPDGAQPRGAHPGGDQPGDAHSSDPRPFSASSGDRPVEVLGYGPIPAHLARDLLASTAGEVFWRRLFTSPAGQIIGGDERRRSFPTSLAKIIFARDRQCTDPFCDAPIRHLDHIVRWSDGGPTTLTNGRGVCARGNYTREMPGWQVRLDDDGLGDQPHTITVTTPTGHSYTSRAPDPP